MNKQTWKNFERTVAKNFGTERTALSGGNSKITRSDTMHDKLFIECKMRKSFSGIALYKNIEIQAKKEKLIPVLILRQKDTNTEHLLFKSNDIEDVALAYSISSLPLEYRLDKDEVFVGKILTKRSALIRLFNETSVLAEKENKTPLVAIKEFRKKDYWFVLDPKNLWEIGFSFLR